MEENKKSFEKEIKQKADKKSEEKEKKISQQEILDNLTAENNNLKQHLAMALNNYKQLENDFLNFKKRNKTDMENAKNEGMFNALQTVLPALDAFRKAKKILTDKGSISGINLIEKNILSSLDKLNVKRIICKGKKFNPDFHDAIMLVENKDVESGTIVEEIETGFLYDDKVVKYSRVVVAK